MGGLFVGVCACKLVCTRTDTRKAGQEVGVDLHGCSEIKEATEGEIPAAADNTD